MRAVAVLRRCFLHHRRDGASRWRAVCWNQAPADIPSWPTNGGACRPAIAAGTRKETVWPGLLKSDWLAG